MPGAADVAGPPAPTEEGEAEATEEGPSAEELADEAAALNAKFDGWVFGLPTWKANAFRMTLEDVLAPLPEPEEDPLELPEEEQPEEEEIVEEETLQEPVVADPPVQDPIQSDPVQSDPPVSDPPQTEDPPGAAGAGGGGL